MNQEVISSALSACLGSLETFVTASTLMAIAVIWPALRNKNSVEFLSIKVERQYAFPVLATVYLFINVAVLILFLRLAFLVDQIGNGEDAQRAFDTIATHSWVLNPYSYFGSSLPAVIYSSTTYGLLIVIWWLCFASIHVLGDTPKPRNQNIFEGLFLAIGLASMLAMQWAGFLMYLQIDRTLDGYGGIHRVFVGKAVMSFLSIGLGAFVFSLPSKLRSKLSAEPASE